MNRKGPLMAAAKYAAHGSMYGVVCFALAFLWGYLTPWLARDIAFLILILVFAGLGVAWGVVNTMLTRILWFPMRKGWKTYLPQGLLLVFAFVFVNYLEIYAFIPLLLMVSLGAQLLMVAILLVLCAFGDGYIAKSIGGHWRILGAGTEILDRQALLVKTVEVKANNPGGAHCPRCGGVNLVVAEDHSAFCLDCKRGLRRELMGGTSA